MTAETCTHRWVLDASTAASPAHCRVCGAERVFSGGVALYTVTPENRANGARNGRKSVAARERRRHSEAGREAARIQMRPADIELMLQRARRHAAAASMVEAEF